MSLPDSIKTLRKLISEMPSMSDKGAERFLEFFWQSEKKESLVKAWNDFFAFKSCKKCFFFAKLELCDLCSDQKRERNKLCVISSPFLVSLIEEKTSYKGLYFVLGGDITGSKDFKRLELVKEKARFLLDRIEKEQINEVILANDFTSQGEATAMFIRESLSGKEVKVTRLARGFGSGDMLSYSDPTTIREAFENRR